MVSDFMPRHGDRAGNRRAPADVDATLEERGPDAETRKQIQQRESAFARAVIKSQGYCTPVLRPAPN